MRLSERIHDFRTRRIASSVFRSKAQKLPLIQKIANANAERLFAMCSGFLHSQVLLACVRGGIIDTLRSGPRDAAEIGELTSIPAQRLACLLRASAAIGLCVRLEDGRYGLDDLGAALCDNAAVQAMILHHEALYADLENVEALLGNTDFDGHLNAFWAYSARPANAVLDTAAVAPYSNLMTASQDLVAEQILDAAPLANSERLLDVGGGEGQFAIAAARRWPHLQVTVADLPAVAAAAGQRIRAAGLEGRIQAVGLDFRSEPLPQGHDLISLVRILHDHDEGPVRQLLEAARSALPANGALIVAEPMAEDTTAGRLLEAYFSIYLLAMGQGQLRTPARLSELMQNAGFASPARLKTRMPLITSVIRARLTRHA